MNPAWAAALGAVLSLGATAAFVRLAARRGWGKAIRDAGPKAHHGKAGTPTMGGAAFLLAWLLVLPFTAPFAVADAALLLLVVASAALGWWDDRLALRRKRGEAGDDGTTGLLARWRLLGQALPALAFGVVAVQSGASFLGVPWLDALGFAFVVVGTINAFNFTDGLDGLAAGVAAVILLAFWADPVAAALLGALLGFLWFNAHPARAFMGGVGAEALGAAVAGLAILHGDVWRLPLLALVPLLEVLSVMAQVSWFRLSGGKRLLRMSPLHHHFELQGWPEMRVVVRFWLVTAAATAVAVATRGPA